MFIITSATIGNKLCYPASITLGKKCVLLTQHMTVNKRNVLVCIGMLSVLLSLVKYTV